MHDNCLSLVIFLKGLELSQNEASQLLVMLNYSVAHNILQLNRCIEQFERFTTSQCRDIMRNQRMIELGWDVIRFWVYELESDMDACVQRVKEWEADSTSGPRR